MQFDAVRLRRLLALTCDGWIPQEFEFEYEFAQNAVSIFLRTYRRTRIVLSQVLACLFVILQNDIENRLLTVVKPIIRIIANKRQLLGAVPDIVVYRVHRGSIPLGWIRLAGDGPCLL